MNTILGNDSEVTNPGLLRIDRSQHLPFIICSMHALLPRSRPLNIHSFSYLHVFSLYKAPPSCYPSVSPEILLVLQGPL